jgi:DNA-binding transcriptional MerR regulator
MKSGDKRIFQAREFANLTGVTVRTLHHYDRLGLLKPSRYSQAGYRLYSEGDFARLEQIVALKFIGFSLNEIKNILSRGSFDLPAELRKQREAIEEKRRRLELAIDAIQRAEYVLAVSSNADWETFAKIIEVINMQTDMNWSKKYYSEEAQQEIEKRAATIPREVIERGQRDWADLIKEVQTAVASGEDPASERSQALAGRWRELIQGFTGGNAEIQAGLNRMYADKTNWPVSMPRPFGDDVQAFITKAMKASKGE